MYKLSPERRDELLAAYCKANNLVAVGSTVFPRRVYWVYQGFTLFWMALTGVFTLWSVLSQPSWLTQGLVAAVLVYAFVFTVFHWKLGLRRDVVEQEIEDMVRLQR